MKDCVEDRAPGSGDFLAEGEQQVDGSGKQTLAQSQKELSKDGEGCFGGE